MLDARTTMLERKEGRKVRVLHLGCRGKGGSSSSDALRGEGEIKVKFAQDQISGNSTRFAKILLNLILKEHILLNFVHWNGKLYF